MKIDRDTDSCDDGSADVTQNGSPRITPAEPSAVAARVRSLKSAVLTAAAKRERLPSELFWSLFRGEIDEIKRHKARKRLLDLISQ